MNDDNSCVNTVNTVNTRTHDMFTSQIIDCTLEHKNIERRVLRRRVGAAAQGTARGRARGDHKHRKRDDDASTRIDAPHRSI